MEVVEDIVIVGAGIAGLTTVGLHRLGIRSLVLESSDRLRTTGFAFTMWTNAWKALDAISIGDVLRQKHNELSGILTISVVSGLSTSEISFKDHDVRCVNRNALLEILENELPRGTIRYSSKVVLVQDAGFFKSIHLSDGTILKSKVLIGCDGVNSNVAKFMGFSKPAFLSRSAIRGFIDFKDGHGFEPKFFQFFGKGVRYGVIPCDDHIVYWFFTYSPSPQDKDIEEDPVRMKQFVLSKLGKVSDKIRAVFENTDLNSMLCSPLRFRHPWELLWGNISKDNVCVAGDALHPMTPDLGQGGCSAIEDGLVLARVLAEGMRENSKSVKQENAEEIEYQRIKAALGKFAKERRWRGFDLISTAYMVGFIQQSDGVLMNFLRDNIMAKFLARTLLNKASFDCGKLIVS
ncbi:FAD/NAD(P)-binding oxidoreductase family protein [Forsythia ovata]|uniref:FAD/NAD(P)-binding oxidoreductase family protein n=1 Tax=Forsythia ovata TaxID=205694 RepID=A0ABD1QPS2_9LAMI